jgi:hypothetical protein
MDPVRNPFAPGAGTPPPELAGRADVLEAGLTALQRVSMGRPAQSLIMVGLRGVGKTVLLNKLDMDASALGYKTVFIEAHEGKSLPELLAPSLRSILYTLNTVENAKHHVRRGLRGLKGFLDGLKVTINDVEFGLSVDAEAGLADSGDIEADLPDLVATIGEAAKAAGRPVALLADELQYLTEKEFSALIMSIHRITQKGLPVILIGAGLPQIRALAGNSKSYAERLFRYLDIGALSKTDAIDAIQKPAQGEGATFDDKAINTILEVTERYPYFLQQWAYESWNVAKTPTITVDDVKVANQNAIEELDQSFFKVRFERCSPSEKRYMRALAELGAGSHRSGDVAEKLGVRVTSVAPTRSYLIRKGMIYSPAHGETAFTVPLFDAYMRREIPDFKAAILAG